eukprot:CAMPEP_0170568186 /NCGR_PEP_ID=MMETSP0211-20121228/81000_1 /TAXON_ID=311385 /ORGANISM="Pseudokeronopsis sp., Strain OXSARD2" /LENGTH=67 /DNA_ID=CAMNT_0010889933 /DNA_START=497 /DNA_END=700 /DNA_ORIENTATION=+
MEKKIEQMYRDNQKEVERISRQNLDLQEDLEEKMKLVEKNYIKIEKHEKILNEEIKRVGEKVNDQVS